jgi:hypothetical protein
MDLVDYLQKAIPEKESVIPAIRWSESNEILPPAEIEPPITAVKLYQYRHLMLLNDENPLPKQAETIWSNQVKFLMQREYSP